MSEKQLNLYRTIQIDAGAIGYDLEKFITELMSQLEIGDHDREILKKGFNNLMFTINEMALLISKTAQLIFEK